MGDLRLLIQEAFYSVCDAVFLNADPKHDSELAVAARQWKKKKSELDNNTKKCYVVDWQPFAYRHSAAEDVVQLRFRRAIPLDQLSWGLPVSVVIEHQICTLVLLLTFFRSYLRKAPREIKSVSNVRLLQEHMSLLRGFCDLSGVKFWMVEKCPIEFLNKFISSNFAENTVIEFARDPTKNNPNYKPVPSAALKELLKSVEEHFVWLKEMGFLCGR